jgi:hypothetical protein
MGGPRIFCPLITAPVCLLIEAYYYIEVLRDRLFKEE